MATAARQLLSWSAMVLLVGSEWRRVLSSASRMPVLSNPSALIGGRGRVLATRWPKAIMLKQSLASMCAAAGLLLAFVSSVHADPLRVPFDIIVGSTHGDMVPIFGVAVHAGDVLHSTLTYDRDAIGNSGEPGFEAFNPITGSIALALGSGLSLPLAIVQVFDDQPGGLPFDLDTVNAVASTTSFPGFESMTMLLHAQGPPDRRSTTALPRSVDEFAGFMTTASFRFQAFQAGMNPPFLELSHEILGRVQLADAPTPTPEPATGVLMLLGAVGTFLRTRRRSCRRSAARAADTDPEGRYARDSATVRVSRRRKRSRPTLDSAIAFHVRALTRGTWRQCRLS
jgi:hypothetical protein